MFKYLKPLFHFVCNFQDHADREWKFYRSKMWMGYFDEGATLPAPFNLIISPKSIYYLCKKLKNIIMGCLKGNNPRTARRKSTDPPDGTIKVWYN